MSNDIKIESVDDLFNDETTKPESTWFKFEKIGDGFGGMLVDTFESDGKFGLQTVYLVRNDAGEEVNIALKNTSHKRSIQMLKAAQKGDMVAFKFTSEYDTDFGNKGKNIEVRFRSVPNNHEVAF